MPTWLTSKCSWCLLYVLSGIMEMYTSNALAHSRPHSLMGIPFGWGTALKWALWRRQDLQVLGVLPCKTAGIQSANGSIWFPLYHRTGC